MREYINKINLLLLKMMDYYTGDPKRIQHFLKVHGFAKLIGEMENVDQSSLFILETAAITHDIGIKLAEEKFGKCHGKLQELLGPDIAKAHLEELDFDNDIIERVTYLIGHHHTYSNIEGLDYQILVEADFLVNFYEDNMDLETIINCKNKIFKTTSGIRLCEKMFR